MKIIQLNSVYGIGSTGRIAKGIHQISKQNNIEILSIYGRKTDVEHKRSVVKIGSSYSVLVHMMFSFFGWNGFGSKLATMKLIRQIDEFKPDIIHIHNLHGYYVNVPLFLSYISASNIKVIWTLHDAWLMTGHCAYFDFISCQKWKSGCYKCPLKTTYPYSFFYDNSKYQYQLKEKLINQIKNITLVTPSVWLGNFIPDSYLNKYNQKVIHNGIDLNKFRFLNSKVNQKFTILGIANPWTSRKGLKYFIELSKALNDDYAIVLVGLNYYQYLTLPKNITKIMATNNIDELVDLYNSADVFVNPTLEDNFPTTNLEALACGTPVITFNTGGSPESINDKTGIVTKDKTTESLINAIKIIQTNGKDYYTKHCIEAAKKFSDIDVYKQYIELYKEIF